MRTYGRVHTAFWTDTKVRAMSERARTLAFYLLTSPHSNMVGAFLLPDAYVADDLGWGLSDVSKTIRELIENGFCKRFSDGRHIAVCKFLSYNPVESSGSGKSIARQFNQLPRDSALIDTVQLLRQQLDRLPESFANDLEMIPGTTSTATSQAQAQSIAQAMNITPAKAVAILPDWIDPEAWSSFLEMRRKKRAPVTDRAIKSLVAKLDKWRLAGHDPTEIIDKSVTNAWADFYEPNGANNGRSKASPHENLVAGGRRIIDRAQDHERVEIGSNYDHID